MRTVFLQMKGHAMLAPATEQDAELLRGFLPNQILKAKLSGTLKARSVIQNSWIHVIFKLVADNDTDPEWDTPEKVKRSVKLAMRFFKDDVSVIGNKVYFELRSFNFTEMSQDEANRVYTEARDICAARIGVDPETLQVNAERG